MDISSISISKFVCMVAKVLTLSYMQYGKITVYDVYDASFYSFGISVIS